jgi:hypothetical protein
MRVCLRLILFALPLIAVSFQVRGENAGPVPRTLEQARAQRQEAEDIREEAQRRYAEEEAACHEKILVGACLEMARERRTKAIIDARRLDAPAREFEREFRRNEVEEEKGQRAVERLTREARQQEQAERYRAEEAEKVADRERQRQKKERKAEENRKKLAERQTKRRIEEEKRAKRQAEQIEKAAKKRARTEEKAADDRGR